MAPTLFSARNNSFTKYRNTVLRYKKYKKVRLFTVASLPIPVSGAAWLKAKLFMQMGYTKFVLQTLIEQD